MKSTVFATRLFALIAIAVLLMPVVMSAHNLGNMERQEAGRKASISIREYIRERLAEKERRGLTAEEKRELEEKYEKEYRERFGNARERMEKAREREKVALERAEERYKKAMETYKEARERWLRARKMARNSTERLEAAKAYVERTGEVMVKYIERLKERIEDSKMDNETKSELISRLDDYSSRIASISEMAMNATSMEELRGYAREMRDVWKEAKMELKRAVGITAASRISRFIEKAESAGEKVESWISRLEEQGHETGEMREMMNEYYSHIEKARQYFEEAKDVYMSENRTGEMFSRANGLLRESYKELREAYRILRDVVREIRKTLSMENGSMYKEGGQEIGSTTTASEEDSGNGTNNNSNEIQNETMANATEANATA